jgi:hypothetical protein
MGSKIKIDLGLDEEGSFLQTTGILLFTAKFMLTVVPI